MKNIKHLILKLLTTPVIAYFLTLFTLPILTSVMGQTWIRDTLDSNAMPIWLIWIAVSAVFVIIKHFMPKKVPEE